MGQDTKISWADHTFSPWWGCVKVSPECDHCYADSFDHRLGGGHWGKESPRRFFGDEHWRAPERWNRAAGVCGVRKRVFCASMSDVFEDRPDLIEPRERLMGLIGRTPNLDWLLLTKRPQNIGKMLPGAWRDAPQPNIWLGTTCGIQKSRWRVRELIKHPAAVHFVSAEPLLGPLVFGQELLEVDWVITGAESGHGARGCNLDWVRRLRDDCQATSTAFFFKQNVIKGIKIETPELDGRKWMEFPAQARQGEDSSVA